MSLTVNDTTPVTVALKSTTTSINKIFAFGGFAC
jgi:hypothetical protein